MDEVLNLIIRKEEEEDYSIIDCLIRDAFLEAEHSNGKEQELVKGIRKSDHYIRNLSLVAELDGEIVGHIMFSTIAIVNEEESYISLALAPLSVLPKMQRKGIGSKLIRSGISRAKELGYQSIVVLGSENYYPHFGFSMALSYGIEPPFEVPEYNYMVIELVKDGLLNVSGTVEYADEFYE